MIQPEQRKIVDGPRRSKSSLLVELLLAASVPVLLLIGLGGGAAIDPRNDGWLGQGDSAQHYVGWQFFASEPFGDRVSAIQDWPFPLGTTIGLSDSIPLLAIPLKALLGSPGAGFQYFGLWIAACLALTAACGGAIVRELGGSRPLTIAGGALCGLSPVLWDRFFRGHLSLCAQFLVLLQLLLWLRLRGSGRGALKALILAGALVVVAAAVHPYLLLLSAAIFAASVAHASFSRRELRWPGICAVFLTAGCALLVARFSGFEGGGETLATGDFGTYRFDLAGFINPAEYSRWLSPLYPDRSNGEGFAYLGLGTIGLGAAGLLAKAARGKGPFGGRSPESARSALSALVLLAVVLAIVAALPRVTLFGFRLFSVEGLLAPLGSPLSVFRALARFSWPLHQLLTIASVISVRFLESRKVALLMILCGAVAIQAAEVRPAATWPRQELLFGEAELGRIRALAGSRTAMSFVPRSLSDGSGFYCGNRRPQDGWVRPALAAARLEWTFDSGSAARMNRENALHACAESASVDLRALGRENLVVRYVFAGREKVAQRRQRGLVESLGEGARCETISPRYVFCVVDPVAVGAPAEPRRRNAHRRSPRQPP